MDCSRQQQLRKIHKYWGRRFKWLKDDEEPCCFVCGSEHRLEICHLIPKASNGENKVGNLVLLCHEHHRSAPNTSLSKEIMLEWIEKEYNNIYVRGIYLTTCQYVRLKLSVEKFMRKLNFITDSKCGNLDDACLIGKILFEKAIGVPAHSKFNVAETIVSSVEVLANDRKVLDEFIKELKDQGKK